MNVPIYQVDAFSDQPFAGNPAAVCLLSEPAEAKWMQSMAAEMNLSETAFVVLSEQDSYALRWFTPGLEVDLCGHATLAAAHVLWTETDAAPDQVLSFSTRSGLLTATQVDDFIELNFPAEIATAVEPPAGLFAALGLDRAPRFVGRNRMDYLVEVASPAELANLAPNFGALADVEARGVIVTSRAASAPYDAYDFVSRFFAPRAGVNEDPVTGSAHCCLGPYWQQQLGKNRFAARQISPRGGDVQVRVEDDRAMLGGQAVTVLRGTVSLPAKQH